MTIDEILWATCKVGDSRVAHVDTESMVQSGKHLLIVNRSILWDFAKSIGGTDYLSGSHTTPCEQTARYLWPMVPSAVFVDPRRATKLTPGDNTDILLESSRMKVFDECRDRLIELRKLCR